MSVAVGVRTSMPVPPSVRHRARPWVEQLLARVETAARLLRVRRSVRSPGVAGLRRQSFYEHMPEEERAILRGGECDHLKWFGRIRFRVQQELDAIGMTAKDAEVDPVGGPGSAWRKARSRSRRVRRSSGDVAHTQ